MLISRRKEGETLFIGDEVEVRIVSVRKKKVIFGVVAPRDVKVTAARLSPAALANTIAAVHSANLDRLLPGIQSESEKPVLLLETLQKAPKTSDKEEGIPS
jgi:carbon storage regulator CsrA